MPLPGKADGREKKREERGKSEGPSKPKAGHIMKDAPISGGRSTGTGMPLSSEADEEEKKRDRENRRKSVL
jgi:hypothetical protein